MITEITDLIVGIAERGLIFSTVVTATYLSSRLIKFDNLSIEGSFGLGGALCALLISYNVNPWLAIIGAAIVGVLSGIATGILNTKLKLNSLISGIVVTTALFSITLKVGGANMSLNGKSTIFDLIPSCLASYQSLILLSIIGTTMFILIRWFLSTEIGLLLQTVGNAPQMITNVGKSVNLYKIIGISLSNSLAAIGGALFVQYTSYFSIWTSFGLLVIGLAGMIIAETLDKNFSYILIIGSIWYQAIIAITFEMQLDQDWNKLITASLIILLIATKKYFDKN